MIVTTTGKKFHLISISMRQKFFFTSIFVLVFSFGFSLQTAQGAEAQMQSKPPIATFSCVPEATVATGENFALLEGNQTVFTCKVERIMKGAPLSVMLLGKQTFGKEVPAASSSNFTLADQAVTTTLIFPEVYRSGKYLYAFSLADTATRAAVAKDVTMTGTLKSTKHALFQSVNVGGAIPRWGAPLTLDYTLSLPEGQTLETGPLTLRIAMQDKSGGECAVFVENQAIAKINGAQTFVLSEQGACNNVLLVVLKAADGTVLEQRVLAIGLPEKKAPVAPSFFSQVLGFIVGLSWIWKTILIIMGVGAFLFLIYALIRKHRGY